MANEYFNADGNPAQGASGLSAVMRLVFTNITAGFAKLPGLSGNANKAVLVNSGGTGLTTTTGTFALAGNFATTGAYNLTVALSASITLTMPGASGTVATLAGAETLTNKTLVAPALGTPASGVATNLTGTAAGLTVGSVGGFGATADVNTLATTRYANINGNVAVSDVSGLSGFTLFVDTADGKLKAISHANTVTILASP